MTKLITRGKGSIDVKYYGNIYSNAKSIKNFNLLYNSGLDLCIVCDTCAIKRYRNFIKVAKL